MEKEKLKDKFIIAIKRKPMTLSELSRKTKISMTWANKLKNRLAEEGLLEFEIKDKRSKLIKLKSSPLNN